VRRFVQVVDYAPGGDRPGHWRHRRYRGRRGIVHDAGRRGAGGGPGRHAQGLRPVHGVAPTDEAFAKLPPGTVESLLKDKAKLTAILTYHVVPGRVTAADVGGLTTATTVQGGALAIDTSAGVKINDATVVQADVMASNGVIHVIDTVLMPPM
jgi:hypothetical protein